MALPPFARKVLSLPAFLLTVFILFWSIPITSFCGSLKFYQINGCRNDNLGWSTGMKRVLRIRILKAGKGELYRGKVMYLLNHRSWADLLVDQYAVAGRAAFLSRWAVALVFPAFMGSLIVLKTVLMFRRGHIADKEKFNRWIDRELELSPCPGLAVYPEGHRSTKATSLPLKRGMLHYAFSRKMPVQAVIGYNKEAILSEKKLTARHGQTVAVGYSDVIYPSSYETFAEFLNEVQATWDAQWHEVFTCDLKSLPDLDPGEPDFKLAPFYKFIAPILTITTNMVFIAVVLSSWIVAKTLYSTLGPVGPVVLAAGLVLLTASLVAAGFPYDAVKNLNSSKRKKSLNHSKVPLEEVPVEQR